MKRRNLWGNKGRVPNNAAGKPKNSGSGGNMIPTERTDRFERTAQSIANLSREELEKRIKSFKGTFKLDFTEDYLNGCSVNKLRHILLAALITGGKPRRKKS